MLVLVKPAREVDRWKERHRRYLEKRELTTAKSACDGQRGVENIGLQMDEVTSPS